LEWIIAAPSSGVSRRQVELDGAAAQQKHFPSFVIARIAGSRGCPQDRTMSLLLILALAAPLAAPSAQRVATCPNAVTTLDMNSCFAAAATKADADLDRYLAAARARLDRDAAQMRGDPAVKRARAGLDTAETAWRKYREAECGAVYDYWSSGTIRDVQGLSCRIALTRAHTHAVWADWLTYMDSTPPVLPEPK
jgi:uncharacterized protein YecT (DUF1311 family)